MTHHKIILDEPELDHFIATLPDLEPHEVWYVAMLGRNKYDPTQPNAMDNVSFRFVARNQRELKEKIQRLEAPLGSYSRDGHVASQECLALYMGVNPRSLIRANKAVLIEMATRIADGRLDFNPISVATTEIHRAVGRKFYVDFDFDHADPSVCAAQISAFLPEPYMYRILKTRGGFHLLVELNLIADLKNVKWHQGIAKLPGCDVCGADVLTPVPGCTQGGFVPHFVPSANKQERDAL